MIYTILYTIHLRYNAEPSPVCSSVSKSVFLASSCNVVFTGKYICFFQNEAVQKRNKFGQPLEINIFFKICQPFYGESNIKKFSNYPSLHFAVQPMLGCGSNH